MKAERRRITSQVDIIDDFQNRYLSAAKYINYKVISQSRSSHPLRFIHRREEIEGAVEKQSLKRNIMDCNENKVILMALSLPSSAESSDESPTTKHSLFTTRATSALGESSGEGETRRRDFSIFSFLAFIYFVMRKIRFSGNNSIFGGCWENFPLVALFRLEKNSQQFILLFFLSRFGLLPLPA